jgi:RNA polymerase sigma-70 factor (ECF subfamily)
MSIQGPTTARDAVERAYEAGRSTWPIVALSAAQFAASIEGIDGVEGLELWPGDFYLAAAAALGDAAAIAAIERECIVPAIPRLRRVSASSDEIEEALQATRERLFVGPRPKIGVYAGTSPLKQWVQLAAVRTVIDLRRSRHAGREVVGARTSDLLDHSVDPATSLLKERYRPEFEAALKAQIAKLEQRDRAILKLHLLEGVSVEKIATMRSVHRVTIARWIWKASDTMLEGVREYFLERHGLIPGECDSLLRLVRSQINLDWARVFEKPGA